MYKKLQDRCRQRKTICDENDKIHFFRIYECDPENFKFVLGDRKLLKAVCRRVNTISENIDSSEKLSSYFEVPAGYTIKKIDTDKLSVGLFFGKKVRSRVPVSMLNRNNMASKLFQKVSSLFSSYVSGGLVPVRPISDDIIKMVNIGCGIRANVLCVFCVSNDSENELLQKRFVVQCETPRNSASYYWNCANLKKHLNHHKKNLNSEPRSDEELEDNQMESKVEDESAKNFTSNTLNDSDIFSECVEVEIPKKTTNLKIAQ